MGLFTKSEAEKAEEKALDKAPQKAIWMFDGNTDRLNLHLADGWEFLSACPTPAAAGGETFAVKNHACLVIIKRTLTK